VPFRWHCFPRADARGTARSVGFRTAGLERILGARDWGIYVLVCDGYWKHARFVQFLGAISGIEGRVSLHGPFRWRDPDSDQGAFIAGMRAVMVEELARVRAAAPEMAFL
jgi:hypothetical protein